MERVAARAAANGELTFDLGQRTVRDLNQFLHHDLPDSGVRHVEVLHPGGRHAIAAGVNHPVDIDVRGHGGYYLAGMNKFATVTVHGNVGWGVAENMMSGVVRVKGFASESAGASGHGGTLIIEGDASLRCGISMKGIDIVVGGSIGNYSAFMAQAGHLLVCGDAGHALGDSLYEAVIYVRGRIRSLGADARIEEMTDVDHAKVRELLDRAGFAGEPEEFKRVASARQLYHWNADANQEY
ncbi:MAG: protein glxC [Betaproteobacteria bacterium]|nr:protein glxC [Betaproteobacteria bacterium]